MAKQFTKLLTPIAPAALLVAVAAGCAGGDDRPAATESASSPVTTASTAADPGDAAALRRYMERVEAEVRAYDAVRVAANSALDGVNRVEPDLSWDRAARQLRKVRARYTRLATALSEIQPPPRLEAAHDGLAESLSLFARIARILAADLDNYDTEAVSGWTPEITPLADRARALRDAWQAAALAALERAGVPPPEWLETLGRADLKA